MKNDAIYLLFIMMRVINKFEFECYKNQKTKSPPTSSSSTNAGMLIVNSNLSSKQLVNVIIYGIKTVPAKKVKSALDVEN